MNYDSKKITNSLNHDIELQKNNELWFIYKENMILIKIIDNKLTIPYFNDISFLSSYLTLTHSIDALHEMPCFCGELISNIELPNNFTFLPLKDVAAFVDEDIFFMCGKAYQILDWDKTHKYCGRCGHNTVIKKDEKAKICPNCGFTSYPRISPAIIVAITWDDKILLAHNKNFPEGLYSNVAGFLEAGEILEDCVKREVYEEVGIKIKNIKYFGNQPWPFPNSLMIGFLAEYESGEINVDGIEILDAKWFTKNTLPILPGPHTIARKMIDVFLNS